MTKGIYNILSHWKILPTRMLVRNSNSFMCFVMEFTVDAGTLLIRTVPSFEGPSIAGITTIEVTICQYDDGLPGHVRWVLFRYDDKLSDIFHRDKVHDVGKLLSQLPRLNPIVLDQMNKGYAPPWNWACGKRVEIWTRMDSRLHAISMWNEGVPAVPTVPVSPRF